MRDTARRPRRRRAGDPAQRDRQWRPLRNVGFACDFAPNVRWVHPLTRSQRSGIALLAVLILALPPSAGAQSGHSFRLGYADGTFTADVATRGPWLERAVSTGADIVRLDIGWVAPTTPARPPSFNTRDPADPAYAFAGADAAIVDATARGLRVLASFTGAPLWAEARGGVRVPGRATGGPTRRPSKSTARRSRSAIREASPIRRAPDTHCRASKPSRSGMSRTSTSICPRSGRAGARPPRRTTVACSTPSTGV